MDVEVDVEMEVSVDMEVGVDVRDVRGSRVVVVEQFSLLQRAVVGREVLASWLMKVAWVLVCEVVVLMLG